MRRFTASSTGNRLRACLSVPTATALPAAVLVTVTGARPGELLKLRPLDLDMTGQVWMVKPDEHKNAWRDQARVICFGPEAQKILRAFLPDHPVDAPLFSPAEAAREQRERKHVRRVTPISCGNRPGSHRVEEPKVHPGDHYTTASYRRCIERACDLV